MRPQSGLRADKIRCSFEVESIPLGFMDGTPSPILSSLASGYLASFFKPNTVAVLSIVKVLTFLSLTTTTQRVLTSLKPWLK